MAIPHEARIKYHLLQLLNETPNGRMYCSKVYVLLAQLFPGLTSEGTGRKYQHSVSKWANTVQWVREHCVLEGLIDRPRKRWDIGYWQITEEGRAFVRDFVVG
jgi:hypothetical protein